MKNIGYKKGFVFVILVVMLLTVPSTLATFTPNVVKTLNNNSNSVDKPDLVIHDATFEYHYLLWHCNVFVYNQGNANVPGSKGMTIRAVSFKALTNKKFDDFWNHFGGETMLPGGTRPLTLSDNTPRGSSWGRMKVYFEVDPGQNIDESNENNNVIWAYFKYSPLLGSIPVRLSDWYQVSKIPESMPRNKATNEMLLLRLLEQFPLLERLLSLVRV